MRKLPLVILGVLVALILFVVLCTFVQRPYESVIVDRFGKIVEPVTLVRGWKLCLPTDKIIRMDHRGHLETTDLVPVMTRDQRTMNVRTFMAWKIVDADKFYRRQTTDDKARDFLVRKIQSIVSSEFAKHTMDAIFNDKAERLATEKIEQDVLQKANIELDPEGMRLEQVGFSRMAFAPSVTDSVYRRMVAERAKQAGDIRGRGQKEATEIEEKGRTLRDKLIEEAKAEAAKLRSEADEMAIREIGAVTETPEAKEWFRLVKSMEVLKASLTRNTWLVLPADSPILTNLLTPAAEKPAPRKVDAPAPKGADTPVASPRN